MEVTQASFIGRGQKNRLVVTGRPAVIGLFGGSIGLLGMLIDAFDGVVQ